MSVIGDLFAIPEDEWVGKAVCAQADPDAWFPAAWNQGKEAKAICHSCPVRAECARYAFDNDEPYGIFGGFSETEREKLRRGRNPVRGPGRPRGGQRGHSWGCKCVVCRGRRVA